MIKQFDIPTALGLPPLPSTNPDTISALLWAREVLQKHTTTIYSVKDPKGIEELKSIKIGGIDQWLHIRGRNTDNPILLVLHGGPGGSIIGLADAIQRPWEDYFTVVQWDQRQTGKSYYPANDENEPLSVAQFITDTEEVIQYLKNHLKKNKLFILGMSWGTVLGMHMVKRHPEWIHAYIGVGQVVDSMKSETIKYERLYNIANEKNEESVLSKLISIAPYPDPNDPLKSFVENNNWILRELSRLAGETAMHHLSWEETVKSLNFEKLISPHLQLTDISNSILGDDIALIRQPYTFTKDVKSNNLPKDIGSSFEAPIFFFTGVHDWQTPRALSDNWFVEINAPHKELIHFEESSHLVINEEPGKFLVKLVNNVLPFADHS